MSSLRLVAIFLIVAGALATTYGGFSYTKETHQANMGLIQLQVTERDRVNIPLWAGLGAIGVGLVLLLVSTRKR